MNEKITILIADDNADFATTLVEHLSKETDMEVLGVARDGKEACEKVINMQPDVLLLDVIMPYLDGLGVLEKLNATKIEKMPTCIMLSAVGQTKITQKAISLGAEYYVVKPFDIDVLINRIRDIKNYKPTPTSTADNCYAVKETKTKYIEISSISYKPNSRNRRTSPHKRLSVLKGSYHDGCSRHRCNKPNNKTTISRNSRKVSHNSIKSRTCNSPRY